MGFRFDPPLAWVPLCSKWACPTTCGDPECGSAEWKEGPSLCPEETCLEVCFYALVFFVLVCFRE